MKSFDQKLREYENHLENEYQRELCKAAKQEERYEDICMGIGKEIDEALEMLENDRWSCSQNFRFFAKRLTEIAEMVDEYAQEMEG